MSVVENLDLKGNVAGADLLAWTAYKAGDMAQAARWIERSPQDAPYAKWVKAKLMLRDGRIKEGTSLLASIAESIGEGPEWLVTDRSCMRTSARDYARADLGMTRLAINDYAGALNAFRSAGLWTEAVYVAERILTVDELLQYVKQTPDIPASRQPDYLYPADDLDRLRYLLAQRLARAERWKEATEFYPTRILQQYHSSTHRDDATAWLADEAAEMQKWLQSASDQSKPPRARAEALFRAGQTIGEAGLDLLGTLPIDNKYFESPRFKGKGLAPTPDELRRLQASATSEPPCRYRAAKLMRQCAELLPDNDPLMAQALYLGGTFIKNQDPKAADYFYKSLVRRNPKLVIAQQADELRWFPREFTDEVVNQTAPAR